MTGSAPNSGLRADLELRRDGFTLAAELVIEAGETVAVLGPNGAGKSTLVRAITGLERIDQGSIVLGGHTLDDPVAGVFVEPHERAIGTAFQDATLFPHLSVHANLAFGVERRRRPEVADHWLSVLGLAGYGPRSVAELSGGEARRVAIGRALAREPALLILDEPFAGLDVHARAELRRLLAGAELTAASRLLITHDPAEAATLADRLVVLEAGRITQVGTPTEVQRRPASRYVADLVGLNLLVGVANEGVVRVGDAGLEVTIADRAVSGAVRLTVAPQAIALHADQPGGSPRNAWPGAVIDLHRLGDLVRVHLGGPVPLVVDVTPGASEELALSPGSTVWVAVKATALEVTEGS